MTLTGDASFEYNESTAAIIVNRLALPIQLYAFSRSSGVAFPPRSTNLCQDVSNNKTEFATIPTKMKIDITLKILNDPYLHTFRVPADTTIENSKHITVAMPQRNPRIQYM
jgi:hypothetical protein